MACSYLITVTKAGLCACAGEGDCDDNAAGLCAALVKRSFVSGRQKQSNHISYDPLVDKLRPFLYEKGF